MLSSWGVHEVSIFCEILLGVQNNCNITASRFKNNFRGLTNKLHTFTNARLQGKCQNVTNQPIHLTFSYLWETLLTWSKISISSSPLCVGFLWPKLSAANPANDGRALKLSLRARSSVTAAQSWWHPEFLVTPQDWHSPVHPLWCWGLQVTPPIW